MLAIEDRTAWARAEQKAREIKPRVRMIKFGTYEVASSNPANPPYTVTFAKQDGHWIVSCTCPAHTKSIPPRPCFHCPAAYNAHRLHVKMLQEVRASIEGPAWPPAVAKEDEAAAPLPVCARCGKSAFAYNEMWLCIDCIKEMLTAEEEEQARANSIETEAERDAVYTMEMEAKDREDIFG